MMSANTGWEDPTEVKWDEEEEEEEKEEPIVPEPKEAIFKCTALYSYTVIIPIFYYYFNTINRFYIHF